MSIQAVSYVLGDRYRAGPEVRGAELLVLVAIANYADDDGVAWPAHATLARAARLSEDHVRRCIRALVARGEIERRIQAAPDSRIAADRRPNMYVMTGYIRSRAGVHDCHPRTPTGVRNDHPPGVINDPGRGCADRTPNHHDPSYTHHHDDGDLVAELAAALARGEKIRNVGGFARSLARLAGKPARHIPEPDATALLARAEALLAQQRESRQAAANGRLARLEEISRAAADEQFAALAAKGD